MVNKDLKQATEAAQTKLTDNYEQIVEQALAKLDEDDLYQTYRPSGPVLNLRDYIIRKFAGVPTVRDWAQIWQTDHSLPLGVPEVDDITPEEQYDWSYADDTDFDREHGITYQDISNYLATVPVDEYLDDLYGDDVDLDYYDHNDREYDQIVNDSDYIDCLPYDDQTLSDAVEFAEKCKTTAEGPDQLVEALTMIQRLRRAMRMRSHAAKIANRRQIALKRRANMETIVQRARKLAMRMLKAKYGNGKSYNDMTYADRARVEKIISDRVPELNALSRKMVPVVRRIEQLRFAKKPSSARK